MTDSHTGYVCYRCREPIAADAAKCPHCGATRNVGDGIGFWKGVRAGAIGGSVFIVTLPVTVPLYLLAKWRLKAKRANRPADPVDPSTETA